jgi:hypothetical protein
MLIIRKLEKNEDGIGHRLKKKCTKRSSTVIIGHQKRIKEPTVVAKKKEDDCTSGEDKNDSVFPVTIKDEFIEDKKKKIT